MFTLPREDQALLEQLGYKRKLADVDDAILANAEFLGQIVANPAIFENGVPGEDNNEETLDGPHDKGLFSKPVAVLTNHEHSRRIQETAVAPRQDLRVRVTATRTLGIPGTLTRIPMDHILVLRRI